MGKDQIQFQSRTFCRSESRVDSNARRKRVLLSFHTISTQKVLTSPRSRMSTAVPTIIDLKISFLRSQILLLSQPLRPSNAFQSSISAEENTLRQRAIDEALHKLNVILKKHTKLRYASQAQRHVAEQVDRLYWNAGERGTVVGEDWAERGMDYRTSCCFFANA